ncbi:MAG: rhamnulokinase, partial [Lentisphaeria bacterium]|nr:rhamnulokinase [Lentisphaeria bacterium]
MKRHLAFDLGASSGRAIVGWMEDGKLQLQEVHRFPNHPYEKDGRFHWNFTALSNELKVGLKKACAAYTDISTFSIDTWGVDVVFFRNGEPIREPYSYRDPRFVTAMNEVHQILPEEELYRMTGIQILSFNTVYQLYADWQDHPEDFRDGAKVLFMPDALMVMLTGETLTEYTIASTGALLDPHTRKWQQDVFSKLNLPADVLTGLVEPCTVTAPLKKELCEELGIPQLTGIRCGAHDTASAVAALPSAEPEKAAYISLGTWALLGAEIRTPVADRTAYLAKYTNEGGIDGTLRFLTNITGTWLLQETKNFWNQAGDSITFNEMCNLAMSVETEKRFDPNDPIFATPGNMPERIAEYCRNNGQGEFSGRAELLRCIYESLAGCFCDKLHELEKVRGGKYEKLHILGGGTK